MMLLKLATLVMHILTLYLVVICKTAKKDLNRKAAGRTPKNADSTPVIKKEQQKEGEEKKDKAEENKNAQKDGDKTALEAEKKEENQKGDEQQQKDKSNKEKQGEEKKEEMGDKNENKGAVKKEDKSKPKGEDMEKNEDKQEQEKERKDKHEDMPPGEVKDKKEDEVKPDKMEAEKKEVKDQEEKKSEKGGDNKQSEMKEEETQVLDPGESQGTPSLHKENADNNLADAALTIYPNEIKWEYEQGQHNIRIKNDTKYRFAFKFRCTDNALYSVSPVMDFVDAGKFVNVAVVRAKGPLKKDKFVICSKQVSEDEKDAYAVFKTGTPHIDTVSMDQLVRA